MMKAIDFINKLRADEVLTESEVNGIKYIHLKTPCQIEIPQVITDRLRKEYEPNIEKGGIFLAKPKKIDDRTLLEIVDVYFIANVSDKPETSYLPTPIELGKRIEAALSDSPDKLLPIRFHTHPTHSDNIADEIFNYIFQSDTSEQDKIVSYQPIAVGDVNLLMPRSIVLCNGTIANRLFIGFYNGLIAPIEFNSHKKNEKEIAINDFLKMAGKWVNEGNNKWWLIGGGVMLALLIIKKNKLSIPLIFLLGSMIPMFINDNTSKTKYFAQLTKGAAFIEIP